MDLRKYFSKEKSAPNPDCSDVVTSVESSSEESDHLSEANPPKRKKLVRTEQIKLSKKRMSFNSRLLNDFPWVRYDSIDGAFCTVCERWGKPPPQVRGTWVHEPFRAWKKSREKMQEHAKSNWHGEACLLASEHERSQKEGTVAELIQSVSRRQRDENRMVLKKLLRCTYYLAKNRIAHTTNFADLVELVIACGADDLQRFVHDEVRRNAKYTSTTATTDFIAAIAHWVEEGLLQSLKESPYFTLMGDECTDVTTMEELSLCFRWIRAGKPVEHFLEVIHVKKTNAETLTSTITTYLRDKGIDIRRMRGMGFDGAATFSGRKTGVQTQLRKLSPHAIFIHCRNHLLQLACVQAANQVPLIKRVYSNLTTLWKVFYYSPKKAEYLKEIQAVLSMPQLSHENTIRSVKRSYTAIVMTLEAIYEESGDAEAHGLSLLLKKLETVATIYMLSEVLGSIARLCKALQTKGLDLVQVPLAVASTLQELHATKASPKDSIWYGSLKENISHLQSSGIAMESFDETLSDFHTGVINPFITCLTENINSRFAPSKDVLVAFSIFDHRHLPPESDPGYKEYGKDKLIQLCQQYGVELEVNDNGKVVKFDPDIDSELVAEEWMTYRRLLSTQKGVRDMQEE